MARKSRTQTDEVKEKAAEPEVGKTEKTEDGKTKTYHGDGIYSLDN